MKTVYGLIIVAATLNADPLSRGERDRAMSHLHATRKMFVDAVEGVSPAQWIFKPGPDRWSIAEVAEHLTVTEEGLAQLVQRLLTMPATPEKKAEVSPNDEKILKSVVDRSQKAQAPEQLRPTGRWKDREAMTAEFKARRDKNITYVDTTNDDLRSHMGPHPLFGLMDAYQWILLSSGHVERHVLQILEVKADPNYPRK